MDKYHAAASIASTRRVSFLYPTYVLDEFYFLVKIMLSLKMKILLLLLFSLFILSCQTGGNWSATKLREWYIENQRNDSGLLSPLFYQGTDEKYHHFLCRSMDTWVPVNVNKEQINISDVRPYEQTSKSQSFPGYYIVDPNKEFAKETETKR